jgi:TPR repeat protein
MNGWGVGWNPFEAFKNFRIAAEAGMAQAQYITGILYSENLIVQKDMNAALDWLNKAKNKDFEPAAEVLNDLAKRDDTTSTKLKSKNINDSNSPLVFIDFDFDTSSQKDITENDLLEALPLSGNEKLISSITAPDSQLSLDNIDLGSLEEAAETGSPEALVMTGYFYEQGKHFTKNLITAGYYYYRAAKLESRTGAYLLFKLNNSFQLYKDLEKKVKADDQEAMFLLYGLKSLSFTDVISDEASKDLLFKSAAAGLRGAIVESAINIYSGRYPEYSVEKGIDILRTAAANNNIMAEQRLISIMIIDSSSITDQSLTRLFEASESGSILAETLLGICYKQGIGVKTDYGLAVKYFRRAAQRGSVFAFEQLKYLHDSLRPDEEIFTIQ